MPLMGAIPYDEPGILFVGDSKTTGNVPEYTLIRMRDRDRGRFLELPLRFAVAGSSATYWAQHIDASIAASSYTPRYILINLGVNDVTGDAADVGDGVQWKINFAYVLDALHTAYPLAEIYIALVWRQGAIYQTKLNAIDDVYIPAVIASRPWAQIAWDERIVIENGDDGVTYLSDGLHYNEAGNLLVAQKWFDLLTA